MVRLPRRVFVVGAVVAGVVLSCCTAAGADRQALSVSLSLSEQDEITAFHVACTGDLPDAALVEAEVYFVKPVLLPPALQKETGEKFERVRVSMGKSTERMQGGKAAFVLGFMRRKPFSGEYVACVRCQERGQTAEVISKIGDRLPLSAEATTVVGNPDDFAAESDAARRELRTDLLEMRKLLKELDTMFSERVSDGTPSNLRGTPLSQPELEQWKNSLAGWNRSLETLLERNRRRPNVEVFWADFVGGRTISLRCGLLRDLAQEYDSTVGSLPLQTGRRERLAASSAELTRLLELDFEYFGFGKQLDVDQLLADAVKVSSALDRLIEWAQRAPGGQDSEKRLNWISEGDGLYAEMVESTMKLLSELQGVSFRNALGLANASAEIHRAACAEEPCAKERLEQDCKRAKDAIERIRAEVQAEPSR